MNRNIDCVRIIVAFRSVIQYDLHVSRRIALDPGQRRSDHARKGRGLKATKGNKGGNAGGSGGGGGGGGGSGGGGGRGRYD